MNRARHRAHARRDAGQISVLIIGLFLVTLVLIVGAVDVTAVQLARIRLVDAADAAALDAADALDERAAYLHGLPDAVALSNETVARAGASYLAARSRPDGITQWTLAPGTGAEADGTAVVALDATVEIPMTGGVLAALGRSVTIHVTGRARAPLEP